MVLFDALNSPRQRKNVETWLTANIRRDLRELAALPDTKRDEYLTNQLVRFRGYYSSGYAKTYTDLKNNVAAALKSEIAKAAPKAATRRRAATAGLTLTAGQIKALEDNYVNSIQKVPVGHEKVMGQGKVKEALSALPLQKLAASLSPATTTPGSPAAAPGSSATAPGSPTTAQRLLTAHPGSSRAAPGLPTTAQRLLTAHPGSSTAAPGLPTTAQPRLLTADPGSSAAAQRISTATPASVTLAPEHILLQPVQRSPLPVQRVDPPGANPDLAQWTSDWTDPQFAGARKYFNETSRPTGTPEDRYKIMCPLYKARGIARPLEYLKNSISPSTTFFGHSTPAHTGMQAMLAAAEKALRALKDDKGNPRFTSSPFRQLPWALNVRTTSKNTWSNHADGRAIDLDPDTNPHLDNKEHRAVITEMTGFDIEARNPGDTGGAAGFGFDVYDSVKMASNRFSAVYNEAGLTSRSAALTADKAALVGQRDAMNVSATGLKAQRQKITKDRDAALKLTKVAAERATIKQQAVLDLKEIDKQQADLKKQLGRKATEIKSMTERADRIAAELKKFTREQKAFDATVSSITAAETGIATATADITTMTALRDSAKELLAQAKKDKKPKAEIAALQKDLTAKSAVIGQGEGGIGEEP